MRINPIRPTTPFKGKINTGMVTLTAMGLISILGARAINKRTNK